MTEGLAHIAQWGKNTPQDVLLWMRHSRWPDQLLAGLRFWGSTIDLIRKRQHACTETDVCDTLKILLLAHLFMPRASGKLDRDKRLSYRLVLVRALIPRDTFAWKWLGVVQDYIDHDDATTLFSEEAPWRVSFAVLGEQLPVLMSRAVLHPEHEVELFD